MLTTTCRDERLLLTVLNIFPANAAILSSCYPTLCIALHFTKIPHCSLLVASSSYEQKKMQDKTSQHIVKHTV